MNNRREPELDELSSDEQDRAILGVSEGCAHLEVDGALLAWEEFGEGIPVVCLHAAGHGSRDFRLLQRESPAGCRLILFDWPGHGRSSAELRSFTVEHCVAVLAGFLNALGLGSAILLGSEFGAAVALSFAGEHPERVRGLVLCQPAGLVPGVAEQQPSANGLGSRIAAGGLLHRAASSPAELEKRRVDSVAPRHALQRNQAALSVLALEDTLRSSVAQGLCPIVVALAARSRAYPLKPFLRFLEPLLSVTPLEQPGLPKLAIFTGRHTPLWEDPARLARVLSGFACATLPLDSHPHSWTLAAVDWPARGMNQWLCTHPGCHAAQSLPSDESPNRGLSRH
jgi:pimeloyl-ACP methyl ester carboxylesterase